MEHRLGRTLRVFLIALSMAGFYRLAIVPWVEPRISDTATALELSPEQAAAIRARADKRLAALGDIFPDGSWERDDPIVLESRQMRLLFKQYHSLPDGRVNLVPCTLVMLPDRNRSAAGEGAGRTLVLRAPQGAVLEFDEPLDLRQGRLAKLVGGSLRGQVTIRGTPTGPEADDEIEIVTRDVELAELEIRTTEMVQFRYGRSTGSGRALVAALLPKTGGTGPGASGPNIGGIDSIRLDRDVRMRLEGFSAGLLSGPDAPRPTATGTAGPATEQPPVLVSCRGALCMNVSANVITFEDKVDVVRTAANGAADQLSCDLLAIMLARGEADASGGASAGGLKPVEIQARGTPVVARSTAAELEAKGARLGYDIATRRILLDGDEPVSLVLQGTEMQARSIDYCPGPPGDPGSLMAVGPGLLKARSAGSPPIQARWQKWLRMRPDGAGHVASLAGEADVLIEGQGRLSAAEMHLWLDVERAAVATPRRASAAGPNLAGVKPARMLARGMVEIDTQPLVARTERMELWFKHVAAGAATPAVSAPGAAAPPGPPAAAQRGQQGLAPAKPADPEIPTRGKLIATGGLVRGLVSMAPDNNQIEEISLENQVHLVEEPHGPAAATPAEPSLAITGDQLQLSRPTRFDARAVVSGRPAKVQGRGLELEGPLVEFDRGRNRLLVDGAGTLGLPMTGAASGFESLGMVGGAAPPAAPAAGDPAGRLVVAWQGRMDFDGQTARFVDRVTTTSGATALHAGSLDVVFTQPMDFSAEGMQRGAPRADVARIACGSGVRIESQSAAADGSRSLETLIVRDLVLDRATGDVSGTGPGRLTSTRFGQGPALGMPAVAAPGQPAPAAPPSRPDELTYLGVDFQKGLRGNMNRRQMEFHQRVEAIWGPVAGWGETLDPHAPGGLAPRAVAITSDVLGVAQAPPAAGQRRSSMELMAGGNVLVEGESFTARSARLSWSEAKDLLVFEGDGRSDAQLFRQVKVGAPMSSASAGKILYWRALNRVDVDDARFLDLDQLGGGAGAPRLPGFGSAPAQPVSRPLPGT
jgi:lipopolysaccharide export system protein LptA